MTKEQNTKELILDIAENLITSRGYNGFSYKDISTELNVKNAAIHYHYPAKKDLGVAVIQRGKASLQEWNREISDEIRSPDDTLHHFLAIYIGYVESGEHICLGGALEADFQTLPVEMQGEVKKLAAEVLSLLNNVISTGREIGVFTFAGPSEDKALFIISSIQGAVQIARVSGKDFFYRIAANVKSELGL